MLIKASPSNVVSGMFVTRCRIGLTKDSVLDPQHASGAIMTADDLQDVRCESAYTINGIIFV